MTAEAIRTGERRLAAAGTGAAEWLCLAAAPVFAIMALVTGVFGAGAADVFCSAAQHVLPLNGMTWMYALMSVFHSAPRLRLISDRKSDGPRLLNRAGAGPSTRTFSGIPPHLSLPPCKAWAPIFLKSNQLSTRSKQLKPATKRRERHDHPQDRNA
jgi:hypothetical protein